MQIFEYLYIQIFEYLNIILIFEYWIIIKYLNIWLLSEYFDIIWKSVSTIQILKYSLVNMTSLN